MALPTRTKKSQTRTNLLISVVFHAVVVGALFWLAASQGVLGTKLREITAFRVKEEKPPEPAKPKNEPKPEEPKPQVAEAPKTTAPPPSIQPNAAPPPATVSSAPPPSVGPDFSFSDGAKVVQSSNDPVEVFKGYLEYSFRSRWNKPEGIDDTTFVAEVEVAIAPDGRVEKVDWKSGSNDKGWDASVRAALAATKSIGRPPPKGFPAKVIVRFDAIAETENLQ